MKNLFTLIELIVVIAVLGILAAIIIPNISSFQEEANDTAIISNVKNLQTSVDMYAMENFNELPTLEQPTEQVPERIHFDAIYPDYTRDLPETEGVKYWVDFNGKVWASTIDAPTGVSYDTVNLKWTGVENAAYYNVFKTTNNITSSVDKKKMVFIKKVEDSGNEVSIPMPSLKSGEEYLVNAVDKNKFESAPAGTGYTGYENAIPTAVIGMTPSSSIKTNTSISWDYSGSTDPDGDSISKAEWQVDGSPVATPPATFSAGNHTVKLRVQDDRGNWSSWKEKLFTVEEHVVVNESFSYIGNYKLYTIPTTGTYKLEVWGAQGANSSGSGGYGGYAYGEKHLNQGTKLYIYVGGQNGWNGGGSGGISSQRTPGGNGGGATDIRVNGTSMSTRIIVAGGGGGGAYSNATGGYGGGLTGGTGASGGNNYYGGKGGTQISGGTYQSGGGHSNCPVVYGSNGSLGQGGSGASSGSSNNSAGGGGGGGYYGGAGGNATQASNCSGFQGGAGGGGSSYVGSLSNSGTQSNKQSGHGQAKITYVGN